jgi:hypothetical protein
MANSSQTLQTVLDAMAGKGIPDPRRVPGGYGNALALEMINRVLADLLTARFNWKFNRAVATPFYTNSWQQDYPQLAQAAGPIGWGEDCDMVDINNTQIPKPLWNMTWRRGLSRTSVQMWRPGELCWMYNSELSLGSWPGPGVTYYPLVTSGPQGANPIMNFVDANGNILILTGFGITGGSQPSAPANSAEGVTVTDGGCTWTVASGGSQGFRLDKLPNQTGPAYQINPYYQMEPPTIATFKKALNPFPDSYLRHVRRGLEAECLAASPNPADAKRGQEMLALVKGKEGLVKGWVAEIVADMTKEGDKEPNVYGLVPLTQVVERRWDQIGPYTADQPY